MHAYDKAYVYDAMEILGEAFDFAARTQNLGTQRFFDLFVQTGVADAFGGGSPRYVAGVSGIELVLMVGEQAGAPLAVPPATRHASLDRTPEYWSGWILAYVQWRSGRMFASLGAAVRVEDLLRLYKPLHEASEDRAADEIEALIDGGDRLVRLKTIRQARGMTQLQLAEAAGTSLRAIQQYEQRVKNIDKAAGIKLYALAQALGCKMEDLLEFNSPASS
ncbi:MAG: helix-turn-helix transcriptional regulator [Gordonibacter sp.]